MKPLKDLVRPNIWSLAPYSSARNEYAGHTAHVFLDANENPYGGPLNRYPDPLQEELKKKLEVLNGGIPRSDEVSLEKKLGLLKYALKQDFKFDDAVIPDSIIEDFVEKVVVYKDKFVWYLTFFDNCDKVLYSNVEKNNRKKTDESVKVWEGAYNGETQHRPL